MGRKAQIIWTSVGIVLAAGLLVAAVLSGYYARPVQTPCTSIEYIIADSAQRMYLSKNELTQMLQTENIYPVGQSLNPIALHRIEQSVRRHPMVRTAECYITPRGEMKIRLTQRVPLLRVQTPGEAYFIDTDRCVMPMRFSVIDEVLLVTGVVGVQAASSSIADFAEWLQNNAYWAERIRHLHVQSPQMAVVYAGEQRVVLGAVRDYDRKLHKLQVFLENSLEEINEKNYTELDVRFRGQVIGRNPYQN